MSESLRNEILLHIHSNLAKKVPFMRDNLEKQERFVCSVLLKLQPDQCAPGDTVIHMGDVGTHMFIVERGCLEAYINETVSFVEDCFWCLQHNFISYLMVLSRLL